MTRLLAVLLLAAIPSFAGAQAPVQAYFGPASADDPNGLFLNLMRFLDSAETSIHASVHEVDMIAVAEKLAERAAAGIEVRLVLEADWWQGQKALAARRVLEASSVKITFDTLKSGLMHNKFFIVDGKRVWTGSTNLTETCLFFNANNAVWVEEPRVAANFEAEFREHEAGKFGKKASGSPNTPHPLVKLSAGSIETYFGPEDEPLAPVIKLIDGATRSIDLMCFVFSSAEIADALKRAHERGVRVRVLLDNAYRSDAITWRWKSVPFKELSRIGVACKYDERRAKLHHKCVIVDREAVLTGSMNLSTSGAKTNDENVLIIRMPDIGVKYTTEFERLWNEESSRTIQATVIHCESGDTVTIQPAGRREYWTIRLIGVTAPVKADRDHDGQEPWGTHAQQWLSLKLTRKPVRVEFDVLVRKPDQESLLGYLWLGDELINAEILRHGHGTLVTDPPNVSHIQRLREAHGEAHKKQLGIWNPKEPLPETPSQFLATAELRAQQRLETIQALELPAYRDGCVIGNRESSLFHVPGGRFYEQSKTSRNAVYFASEQDAQKAGFQRAAR